MKKFAPLVLSAAAMAFAGCAAEAGNPGEVTGNDSAAVCANPDGTNAAIAALAEAITHDLHRWQITSDFYVGTGTYNQQVLKLTSAGLAACGGQCLETQNILAFQDATMDQVLVLDGTHVSSYSFASRLVTGWNNQWTCQGNTTKSGGGRCPFVAHMFDFRNGAWVNPTISAGPCDMNFTHPVGAPSTGAALTSAQVSQLANALVWTTGNGPNPYIAFQPTASTVSIDPTGDVNSPSQQTGGVYGCNALGVVNNQPVNLTGLACTCVTTTTNIPSGVLKATKPVMAPNNYQCVTSL
ncbi:MAG TPA: hypothetical protein VMI54_12275 [Polyangiaceae bacterium]|nr:hypothetical protein [Polyangiaceae bacterium]